VITNYCYINTTCLRSICMDIRIRFFYYPWETSIVSSLKSTLIWWREYCMIINRLKSVLMNCLLINCDKDHSVTKQIVTEHGKIKVVWHGLPNPNTFVFRFPKKINSLFWISFTYCCSACFALFYVLLYGPFCHVSFNLNWLHCLQHVFFQNVFNLYFTFYPRRTITIQFD